MKILWLAPIPLLGELNSHPAPWIITLAKKIVDQGDCLTIVNYNSKIREAIVKIETQNINIIYIKTPVLKLDFITLFKWRIKIVNKFLKKIADNYDILHIHGLEHQYEAMASGLKIPKIISIQGIMEECVKFVPRSNYKQYLEWKLKARYESKNIPIYKNYSCRTEWDSSYIRKKNPEAKIYMIWEMIRQEFYMDHFSDIKENLLFVGGNNFMKGLKEVLIAYNNSIQELGFKLIILGNCTIEDVEYIMKINELRNVNISNIDCRGMQDVKGMINAYNESYCLVHPTYIDNSPNSVCEAQLSGLPVIATNVGGVSSLIKNMETGMLIDNNPKAIEIAVKQLYLDDDLRNLISKNSRTCSRLRHNYESILSQTLKMYDEIISNN